MRFLKDNKPALWTVAVVSFVALAAWFVIALMQADKDFMPHGVCMLWNPALLATVVTGNLLVCFAYMAIPVVLASVIKNVKTLPRKDLWAFFAVFIFLCGCGHFLKVLSIWVPFYWVEIGRAHV